MKYIDVLIPAIGGVLFFFFPGLLVKKDSQNYFEKEAKLKKMEIVLILVALVYFGIKFYSPE